MTILLTNDLHKTSIEIRIRMARGRISERQRRKVKLALCGSLDCPCSGPFGSRGEQEVEIQEIYNAETGENDGGEIGSTCLNWAPNNRILNEKLCTFSDLIDPDD